ncbi:MAG: methyltransferase domain-containing protein [Candidatus Eisenbacteria bacterium]|nr:methyltransferase domain-containing protein [Candidatus Eisenbacteria bacterium]
MRSSTPEHWERYWRAHRRVEETYDNEERLLAQLRDLPLPGRTVLEVGAGSGRDSLEIAARGARVVLVDYVMESFAVVRGVAAEAGVELHCVCCDARALPFREGSFDLVFHQGVLEHFRDPMPLLRENYRVTRPGGHCLVDVPQRYHPYTLIKHLLIALNLWFAGWETEFSPASLRRVLRACGYEIVRVGGDWMVPGFAYRSLRYVLRQWGIARLPKYPRELPLLGAALRRLRAWVRRRRIGPWTFAMVNVLGRRPSAP